MTSLINWIFPFSSEWSWGTFFFYVAIGITVSQLCYKGACLKAKLKKKDGYLRINGYYLAAYIILVLLATLRTENVGPDTKVYLQYFHEATSFSYDMKNLFTLSQTEIGFLFYLYVLRSFTDSNILYFLVTYAWIAGAYIYFIKNTFDEKSDYMFLQLFIVNYSYDMSSARSAIGTAFILISLVCLNKNKNIAAIILTVMASTFHYTMIYNFYIIIAVWLFKNRKFFVKRSLWIAGFVGMAFIAILGLPLLKELLKDTKYRSYIKLDFSVSSLLGTVFIIAFAVLCMLFYYKIIQSSRYEKIAVPFITSLAFLVMYPMTFLMGAYRIPRYYAMPRLAVWSEMVDIDKKISHLTPQQNFIIYRVLLQFILLLYMLFLLTRWASNGCFAYECIFFS